MSDQNQSELKKLEWTPGATMVYTLERNGAQKKVKVTLAPIPETVLAQWVGQHMLDQHVQVKLASLD
jgi:hypothetical protein